MRGAPRPGRRAAAVPSTNTLPAGIASRRRDRRLERCRRRGRRRRGRRRTTCRRCASAGDSSASAPWCRNFSAGELRDLGPGPDRAVAAQAQRAVGRRGGRRGLELERAGVGGRPAAACSRAGQRTPWPAELVERQAGVERRPRRTAAAEAIAPVSTPRSLPRRAAQVGDAPATRRARRPGGRSPGAGAGRGRRGG